MHLNPEKFVDPNRTLKGDKRAKVALKKLETLWINTGTRCNLSCQNCYIESNPTNDRLVYIQTDEVKAYLDEIKDQNLGTKEIAFTGGEPFLNPDMIDIISLCLKRGFEVIVLTNAYMVINRYKKALVELNKSYPTKLLMRVSLDHYSKEVHDNERGPGTFEATLKNIKWLYDNDFQTAIAGRSLTGEDADSTKKGYIATLKENGVVLNSNDPRYFVIFPEMDEGIDVPEITQECFSILNVSKDSLMCSNSRMVVKRKGEDRPKVLACTLLAYDEEFELGTTLKDSNKVVPLNHPHCSKFCVLGGASCSS